MSHIGLYQTNIKRANKQFAKLALELLAQENQLEIRSEYTSKWNNSFILNHENANIGVLAIANGFGVHVNQDGKLEIVGDAWSDHDAFYSAQARFIQLYQAIALNYALERLGYQTNSRLDPDRVILVGEKA